VPVSLLQVGGAGQSAGDTAFRNGNIALVNYTLSFSHLSRHLPCFFHSPLRPPFLFGFMRFPPRAGRGGHWPADRPVVPVLAGGSARSASFSPLVEAGGRPQQPLPDYVVQRLVLI